MFGKIFVENCTKIKDIGQREGTYLAPPPGSVNVLHYANACNTVNSSELSTGPGASNEEWQGRMHGRGCVWQGACMVGKACMARGGGWMCVAGDMATAAGGTHPTGMHSCIFIFFPFSEVFRRGDVPMSPMGSTSGNPPCFINYLMNCG